MSMPPGLPDEDIRHARLAMYDILDTPPETAFDRITRLAALSMGTGIAAIGFYDTNRVWYKSRVGMPYTAIPRAQAICAPLLTAYGPVIAPDTMADPGFRNAPLVTGPPHLRFFAGVPLRSADGVCIGALCVMDNTSRTPPTLAQIAILQELAAEAMVALEQRRLQNTSPLPDLPGAAHSVTGGADGAHRNLLAAYTAKSEFLSSLSHELRTPLNAMVGFASLIASTENATLKTAEYAEEISSAARHMLALVNDILEYSRLEAGILPIGWQRVTLSTMIDEALRMVGVFASSRGVRLVRDVAWPEAVVRADPVRIKQVLLNLLTNAIKFTPRDGTVTLSLSQAADGQAELAVRDTGVGIAEKDIEKVLTPFGQIVPQNGNAIEGTGLGLPITKALVERQGGHLVLESRLGEGTVVRALLPSLVFPMMS